MGSIEPRFLEKERANRITRESVETRLCTKFRLIRRGEGNGELGEIWYPNAGFVPYNPILIKIKHVSFFLSLCTSQLSLRMNLKKEYIELEAVSWDDDIARKQCNEIFKELRIFPIA